jgi:hypothetical protein
MARFEREVQDQQAILEHIVLYLYQEALERHSNTQIDLTHR